MNEDSMNLILHEVSTHFKTFIDLLHKRPNSFHGYMERKGDDSEQWFQALDAHPYLEEMSFDEPLAQYREALNSYKKGNYVEAQTQSLRAKDLLDDVLLICEKLKRSSQENTTFALGSGRLYAVVKFNGKIPIESEKVTIPLVQSMGTEDPQNETLLKIQIERMELEAKMLNTKILTLEKHISKHIH
jgi:hypothetical protein